MRQADTTSSSTCRATGRTLQPERSGIRTRGSHWSSAFVPRAKSAVASRWFFARTGKTAELSTTPTIAWQLKDTQTGRIRSPVSFGTASTPLSITWKRFILFSILENTLASDTVQHQITVPVLLWRRLIVQLRKRGKGRSESGAFLLAPQNASGGRVKAFICYD